MKNFLLVFMLCMFAVGVYAEALPEKVTSTSSDVSEEYVVVDMLSYGKERMFLVTSIMGKHYCVLSIRHHTNYFIIPAGTNISSLGSKFNISVDKIKAKEKETVTPEEKRKILLAIAKYNARCCCKQHK